MSVESRSTLEDIETSLSKSEDDENELIHAWESLFYNLSTKHLKELCKIFIDAETQESRQLTREQFRNAIDFVVGNSKLSVQALCLYDEIKFPEEQKLTWSQFLDFYIDNVITKPSIDISLAKPEIYPVPHVKRETVMKIVLLETDTSFCYAIISKFGKVGLYTGDFSLLRTYNVIFTRSDRYFGERYRLRKTVWITDAIFLPNVRMFIICCTTRSMIIYDASGQRHLPMWLIEGIPNVIHCLEYHSDVQSKLFLGDEFGQVTILTFLQQRNGLLRKKYTDKLNTFYWRELQDETEYLTIQTFKRIHTDLIKTITYYPEIYTFVSCSRDENNSIVFFNMKERKKSYVFKISKGVSCIALSQKLHILITGHNNADVQIWNIYVPSNAVTSLPGHKVAIVDVKILEHKNVAISCSKDGILKLWDLSNFKCVQSISIDFPPFRVLGKLIEWSTTSIYPGPKRTDPKAQNIQSQEIEELNTKPQDTNMWNRSMIIIICCNYMAKIKINFEKIEESDEKNILLPPPPMQNSVKIPETWKIAENTLEFGQESDFSEEIKNYNFGDLEDILTRDFLKDKPKHDMNFKIAVAEKKKTEMRKTIAQCAPFLALDLFEMDEVKLSENLPVSNCKITKQLAERTHRLVSAASTRSGLLSDRSSKSRSSRSSVVEF